MTKPRFRHNCKTATYLGHYGEEDLWYQQGQVVARFGSEPQDFLMAGSTLAEGVDSLREAMNRARERELEMDTGEAPIVIQLTTSELIALASEENRQIEVTLTQGRRESKHTIHALNDGRIIFCTDKARDETTTKKFKQTYPDDMGEIWGLEQGGGPLGLLGDDDDDE
jgi:hypothetical protein